MKLSRLVRAATRRAAIAAVALVVAGSALAQGAEASPRLGQETYANICSSCHQANGEGIPGAFPPLAGHAADIASVEGGVNYLVNAVLFGVIGEIRVDGETYRGQMPAWGGQLSDAQVAAVVNHVVTSWGGSEEVADTFDPVSASDVAQRREPPLTSDEVHALREEILPGTTGQVDGGGGDDGDGASASAGGLEAGIYTEAQADRGRELYGEHCSQCHGGSMTGSEAGPGLAGPYFDFRWGGQTVGALLGYAMANMPLGQPGTLRDEEYAAIVAAVLRENGYPAGDQELPADPAALQDVTIADE